MHITTGQNLIIATTIDQPHTTIMKMGTDTVGLDHSPILIDITAKVAMTPTEAIPGHTSGTTDDITGVVHATHIQALIHIVLTVPEHNRLASM